MFPTDFQDFWIPVVCGFALRVLYNFMAFCDFEAGFLVLVVCFVWVLFVFVCLCFALFVLMRVYAFWFVGYAVRKLLVSLFDGCFRFALG